MAIKPAFTMPLILIRNDGWTEIFYDFESLVAVIYPSKISISDSHVGKEWYYFYDKDNVRHDRGRTVTAQDLVEYAPWKKNQKSYFDKKRREAQHCRALGLPIPHTGGNRWRGGGCYRVPHHIAALRYKAGLDVDYRNEKIKIPNKEQLPPTAWDDCIRASLYNRNWKKYRKHQWKSKD